jgi:glycosyltransferase involved in cell wall biosynthesis
MAKVSVIIPTYNRAHVICRAIDSVLAQTYPDYEIIVVDDGSTDQTAHVLSFYTDRIRYIYQANGGVSKARENTGIKAAAGEYICFLDSDDAFLPNKLELQVGYLDNHPEIDVVLGGWQIIDDASGEIEMQITQITSRRDFKSYSAHQYPWAFSSTGCIIARSNICSRWACSMKHYPCMKSKTCG